MRLTFYVKPYQEYIMLLSALAYQTDLAINNSLCYWYDSFYHTLP